MICELTAGSEAASGNDGGASPAAVEAIGSRHDEAGAAVNVIVKANTVVDAKILNALMEHDIEKVRIIFHSAKKVNNPDLIDCTVQDDIEVVIKRTVVKADTVIDAKAIEELKKHGIRQAPIVEGVSKSVSRKDTRSRKVTKSLIGCALRDDIEASIKRTVVKADTVIDAKAIEELKKHGIRQAPIVEGVSKIVSRKVTSSRKVGGGLLGRIVHGDVEVKTAVPSFNDCMDEISKGDGILSELTGYRRSREKGDLPDSNAVQRYKGHISDMRQAFAPYFDARKSAAEHLRRRFGVDEFNVPDKGFYDLQGYFKSYIEAFDKFLAVLSASVKGPKSFSDEYRVTLHQALMRTRNFNDAKGRFDRDVQRKIDGANSRLPDEDKAQMIDGGVNSYVIAPKDGIVDEVILKALMEHGIERVKVVSFIGNKALLGRTVYNDIKDDKGNAIVEKGVVIDAKILNTLMEHGIETVRIVSRSAKKVDSPDLIGCKVADDIEGVEKITIKEGAVIDDGILNTLMEQGIERVKVVSFVGNKDLLGRPVYDDIKDGKGNVIVEKGVVIDAKILKTLMEHGIDKVRIASHSAKKVNNPALIGCTVRDDVEVIKQTVVKSNAEIDKGGGEAEWLRWIIARFYKPPAQRRRELARRLRQLDAAVGAAPDSLTHYVLRGELFLQIKDCDRAKADFEAALELAEAFDPTKGWGLVEQVMRDRALRGLDLAQRRL